VTAIHKNGAKRTAHLDVAVRGATEKHYCLDLSPRLVVEPREFMEARTPHPGWTYFKALELYRFRQLGHDNKPEILLENPQISWEKDWANRKGGAPPMTSEELREAKPRHLLDIWREHVEPVLSDDRLPYDPRDWEWRRLAVYDDCEKRCNKCGAELAPPHRKGCGHTHHKVPRSKGGSHSLSNLELLCARCHNRLHGGLTPHNKTYYLVWAHERARGRTGKSIRLSFSRRPPRLQEGDEIQVVGLLIEPTRRS
jgi:5-methylcytosine-specific restriction endonuclease McrA